MNNNKSEIPLVRKKYNPQFKDQALDRIAKDGVRQRVTTVSEKLSCIFIQPTFNKNTSLFDGSYSLMIQTIK